MLSKNHIELSIFSAILLFGWLIIHDAVLLFFIGVGVFVGSLIPDTDIPKSKMDSMEGIAGLFALLSKVILNPLVARIFGFLLKRPIDQGHRGITHSVYGILAYCIVIEGLGLPILWLIGFWGIISTLFSLFVFGLFFGGILHLAEDACTKSGITPFYPFNSNRKYSGTISTFDFKDPRPLYFTLGLLVVSFTSVIIQILMQFPREIAILFSVISFCIVWKVIFMTSNVTRNILVERG